MASYKMLDENAEVSDSEHARLAAIARRISAMRAEDERKVWDTNSRIEMGDVYECEECEEDEACESCKEGLQAQAEKQADRELEIEMLESKLEAAGARMARPYEHHNEDERYFEYMERDR